MHGFAVYGRDLIVQRIANLKFQILMAIISSMHAVIVIAVVIFRNVYMRVRVRKSLIHIRSDSVDRWTRTCHVNFLWAYMYLRFV